MGTQGLLLMTLESLYTGGYFPKYIFVSSQVSCNSELKVDPILLKQNVNICRINLGTFRNILDIFPSLSCTYVEGKSEFGKSEGNKEFFYHQVNISGSKYLLWR